MNKSIIAFFFILASATIVYFSSNFEFIKHYLKISPHLIMIVAGLAFLVCLRFNKSRVSFIVAILLLWFFKNRIPYLSTIPQNEFIALMALNIFFMTLSRERGVFTVHGLRKVISILLQLGLVYYFTVYDSTLYVKSGNAVIRGIHSVVNLPYCFFPLLVFSVAALSHILGVRSHDIAFAVGTVIGVTVLYARGMAITELNMLVAFVLMFVGTLFSIYTISYKDELTGLPGRRAYNEYIETLGSRYTIAMSDIDHFKKFNDKHGHETGDEILKLVAGILSAVGGGGKSFRFGGEEFVIVFNGKIKEETAEYLEDLRERIEQARFTVRNRKSRKKYEKSGVKAKPKASKNVKITMSFGASDARDGNNPTKVMKEADVALYKSKKRGRNRVTV